MRAVQRDHRNDEGQGDDRQQVRRSATMAARSLPATIRAVRASVSPAHRHPTRRPRLPAAHPPARRRAGERAPSSEYRNAALRDRRRPARTLGRRGLSRGPQRTDTHTRMASSSEAGSAREAPATSRQHVRATLKGASSCRMHGEGSASDEPTARTSDPQRSEFVLKSTAREAPATSRQHVRATLRGASSCRIYRWRRSFRAPRRTGDWW